MIGRVVGGQYRVLERLGAGSTGTVYLARDLNTEQNIALKMVDPEHEGRRDVLTRFEQEALCLSKINSEHVVQLFAYGHSGSSAYVAMEHVEGRELESILAAHREGGGSMPLDRVVQIVRAVADALAATHRAFIVHRDVKPANVVIENGSGRAVLIDFGLARAWTDAKPCPSAGSPAYMAPEQIRGLPDTSGAGDTYALACMAFEMLTGEPVFGGEVHQVLASHLEATPPAVSSLRPDLSAFDAVIERALLKAPALRWPSPKDFARELAFAADSFATTSTVMRSKVIVENVHVLVVAWDPQLRHTIINESTRALQHDDRVLTVESITRGDDVAAAMEQMRPAIIVIDDDSMLEGTGLDLVAEIRGLAAGVDTQIVLLTQDLAMNAFRARELRAHCLSKPLNLRTFGAVIGKGAQPTSNRRRKVTTPGL